MIYSELILLLKDNFEIEKIINNNNLKITDVKLIDKNIDKWNERTLYIGNFSLINSMPNSIMMLGTDKSPLLPEKSSYSIISIDDINNIFHAAKDFILEDLRSEAALFELTQEVLNKKNILSLINHAADLLGNALILTDVENRVLSYSTNYEIMDPLWAKNIELGYCSGDFIKKVRMNQQMKDWNKSGNDVVKITLDGDNQAKLVSRIIYDGHVAGSLIMIEHHTKITHSHYKQLLLIGNILFDSLNYDFSTGMKKSFYSSVLYNLLDEKENDKSELINITKLDFPRKMQVVVAQFIINQKNRYLKFSIKIDLERIFPEGYSVIFKSYIIILVPDVSENQRERLKELSLKENLSIGISWIFNDIFQFKRYFYQSVTCIKHGNKDEKIHDYTSFSFYDMLLSISNKATLEYYCHPALKILFDYDYNFYLTLRTYLECNKNVSETAEKLFIHRNTLNYRIKRIKELTGLDLDNSKEIQCLMDSYRIEMFLSKST
ncbi:helix-turn-helix domain-containing protein [Sedimentibacter sp.]|uniref:PucR family transcriptional regulator n=1 Tax=Sedimentibacter sp. TaxID=1960295 RepID=UPI00289C0A9B|nr:helix-turn-helix domain-containing protein [Sedimentibacter sp.]